MTARGRLRPAPLRGTQRGRCAAPSGAAARHPQRRCAKARGRKGGHDVKKTAAEQGFAARARRPSCSSWRLTYKPLLEPLRTPTTRPIIHGVVHARVGQIVTFFAYKALAPLAAPCAPPRLPSPGGSPTRLGAALGHSGEPLRQCAGCSGVSPSHRPSTGSCHWDQNDA